MSRLFSHDKLLWHLELHSLFDFLHEKKYFGTIFSACILYPLTPNSDALPAHSLNETLIDGTSGMLTVPSAHAYVLNWLRVHNKFSIPSFVRILYRSLVRSTSITTPQMVFKSHFLRSTSGTRTFTVLLIFL